jgi:DNA repair exonuclease SbcCD nuclease subunit
MKLFHTADVHLDHSFAGSRVPAAIANWRRQHLRELFMELLRRAASEQAGALLIAGDLFEAGRVNRDTVAFLREAFDLARPVQVFIAPGQTDPFGPASPYATESWPDNVHIFREPAWASIPVPGQPLVIHGAACVEGGPAEPPFDRLHIPEEGAAVQHVAVVHACWRPKGAVEEKSEAPRPALPQGVAYLALGHAHGAQEVARRGNSAAWYCGAPETFNYGQPGVPGYLEVTISDARPPAPVAVRVIATQSTRYLEQSVDCSELTSEAQVSDSVLGIGRSQECDTIARIILTGRRPPGARWSRERMVLEAGKNFVHLELIDETEIVAASRESLPESGSLALFHERMTRDIAGTADPARKALLRRAETLGNQAYHGGLPGAGDA